MHSMSSDPRLTVKVLTKDPTRSGADRCLAFRSKRCVRVTWGQDSATDREYIRVSDSGCGMTREVLELFHQAGQELLLPSEYEREQQICGTWFQRFADFPSLALASVPFMLADEIRIVNPSGSSEPWSAAYDVRSPAQAVCSGYRPAPLSDRGTEITLYLKQPFQLDHDRTGDSLAERAFLITQHNMANLEEERQIFEQQKRIDPLWIIGRYASSGPCFPFCFISKTTLINQSAWMTVFMEMF